jgi:hypothetical protein
MDAARDRLLQTAFEACERHARVPPPRRPPARLSEASSPGHGKGEREDRVGSGPAQEACTYGQGPA